MKYSERRPLRNAYGASPFYDFMARALLEPQEPKRIQSLRKSRQSFGWPECGEKLVQGLTIQETRFYCMRCLRKAKRARAEFDRDLGKNAEARSAKVVQGWSGGWPLGLLSTPGIYKMQTLSRPSLPSKCPSSRITFCLARADSTGKTKLTYADVGPIAFEYRCSRPRGANMQPGCDLMLVLRDLAELSGPVVARA